MRGRERGDDRAAQASGGLCLSLLATGTPRCGPGTRVSRRRGNNTYNQDYVEPPRWRAFATNIPLNRSVKKSAALMIIKLA